MTWALVVGGTGPTGPFIIRGLAARGYDVTMYHRGEHEIDEELPPHEHVHGDPFTFEAFSRDMEGRQWEVVVSMYGRLRYVADALAGHTRRLVGITGGRALVSPEQLPYPSGREVPLQEDHPTYTDRDQDPRGFAIAATERDLLAHQTNGHFQACVIRYTNVYGPRAPSQWLAPIVRRALDGRRQVIVPGDGCHIDRMLYAENAAHLVVLACEHEAAGGRVFNAVDNTTYPIRDAIRIAGAALNHEFEVVGISHPLAHALARGYAPTASRQLSTAPQKALLGYEDVVPPEEAIARTVRWLAAHQDSLAGDQRVGGAVNPYAYDVEDQLIASFKSWQRDVDLRIQGEANVG